MGRLEKGVALFLQAGAAGLFIVAGTLAASDDFYLVILGVPGAASALAGMLLWGRSVSQPLTSPEPPKELERKVDRIEELLTGLQEDLVRQREDGEFLQQLYSGSGEPPLVLPEPQGSRRAGP